MSKKIIELRESKGWSQAELARRSKVNRSYLNRIENEKHKPGLSVLSRIANALEVTIKELL